MFQTVDFFKAFVRLRLRKQETATPGYFRLGKQPEHFPSMTACKKTEENPKDGNVICYIYKLY